MRLTLAAGEDPVAAIRRAVTNAADVSSLVVVTRASGDPLALALARAAIGPLAIECAPGRRVNMVVEQVGARPVDIDAAVTFLESARSTTGQILEVG